MTKGRTGLGSLDDFLVNWRVPQQKGKTTRADKKHRARLTGPNLMDHCRRMDGLEKLFVRVLPAEMRREFKLAKYNEGELVVFCQKVQYASYLKYHNEEIMEILRNVTEFEDLVKIKIYRQEV